jgi:BirA family biotin operon repressor/biotin-[acetyl-CoA-carboxylase] ligase
MLLADAHGHDGLARQPDRFREQRISRTLSLVNFALHADDCVDSTSERAFAALRDGTARHGDVHWAREQTAGRGRRGAAWHSARDEGMYASVVLLPSEPIPPAALTMAAGTAVCAAVRELGVAAARLKWPNDVVVESAKLAGILVETRGLDPLRPHYVVGIGVNVAQREFPAELVRERAVTSLALCGASASVESVLERVTEHLERALDELERSPDRIASAYLDATELRGREVVLEMPEGELRGHLAGLSLARGVELARNGGSRSFAPLEHVRQLRAAPEEKK